MNSIKKIVLLICLSSLSACQWLAQHKIHTQQGNVIQNDRVAQLRAGMSPREVLDIMGSPVYDNTFDRNRWVYIYTRQDGNRDMVKKKAIVVFRDQRLVKVITA